MEGKGDFSLFKNVHTGFGAHPASYLMCTGVISSVVKQPGLEVNNSSPSSAEVKNEWSYTCPPPICFYGVDRKNLTF
jgi:hypothetical protein